MGNDERGNELPFVYNLRGIIEHLTKFHCETHKDNTRDMIRKVAMDMVNKDINQFSSPMFCWQETIPKASSTSCLNATWKSNQTDLTQLPTSYRILQWTPQIEGYTGYSLPIGLG